MLEQVLFTHTGTKGIRDVPQPIGTGIFQFTFEYALPLGVVFIHHTVKPHKAHL